MQMRPTGLRISGGRTRELARVDDRPLQPLDGRREAPDRKRMAIRSPDGLLGAALRSLIDLSAKAAAAAERRERCVPAYSGYEFSVLELWLRVDAVNRHLRADIHAKMKFLAIGR